MRCTNWSSHRLRSFTGSLALYSSLVSSVLKKLLTLGWPARSTWSSLPSRRTLHRPQMWILGLGSSSLVGNSIAVENTFAFVFESTRSTGRLECVQVAEVEPLIAERRAKTESGEMV